MTSPMDTNDTNTVAATLANQQYKMGRTLIDEGRLEEAVDFFSGLLEVRVKVLGDEMSPALAPLYYEYGNSLLYNAEESGAVFGDAITDAEKKRAMAIVEAAQSGDGKDGSDRDAMQQDGGDAGGGGGTGGALSGKGVETGASANPEAEDDLEIAWENLEMARRIYSTLEMSDDIKAAIAKVHIRLGDLNMVNGMYNEAAEEFEKCLGHRLALPNPKSRGVADAHVRRAQALFYASTLKDADKDALVTHSLEQYHLAAGVFENMLTALKTSSTPPATASPGKENAGNSEEKQQSDATTPPSADSKGKGKGPEETPVVSSSSSVNGQTDGQQQNLPTGSAEEIQDVLDAIRETIETMSSGKDMEALAEYKSGAVSTTVGFGETSVAGADAGAGAGAGADVGTSNGAGASSRTPALNGEQKGFGVAAGAGVVAGGGAAAPGGGGVNVMMVKRKGRPAAAAPKPVAANGSVAANADGIGNGGDAKRVKSGE